MTTIISFPIAKQLKEKGFNEVCQRWYSVEGGLYYQDEFYNNRGFIPVCECEAPTITETIMWLYEKHGIWIVPLPKQKDKGLFWGVFYSEINKQEFSKSLGSNYKSPTEAYEAAIEYVLTKLI